MDNKGWGLHEMLAILAVLGFALILVAILYGHAFQMVTKEELVPAVSDKEKEDETTEDHVTQTDEIDCDLNETDYELLERNIAVATERYVKEKNGIAFGNTTYISIEEVKINGYLEDYKEQLSNCRGYVEYRVSDQTYQTYLSCPNYQTNEYSARYAN